MTRTFRFYEDHGAEEYYLYDPDEETLQVWLRAEDGLIEVRDVNRFISPLLKIRLDTSGPEVKFLRPDGHPFLSFIEQADLARNAERERSRAEREADRAEAEMNRAEVERVRAETEKARADALVAKLRALGVDLNSP
jgi:hypothetical protein